MRFSKWSVLALSVLSKANEQYPPLELKLSISRHPPASFTHLSKRDVAQDDIELGLLASHTFYRAKVRFGSEQEPVDLLVDTGSCSTWVMTKDVECFHSQQLMVDARLSRRQEGAGPIIEDAPVGVLERIPETGAQQQPQKIALPKTPVAELKHIDGQKCKRFGSFDSSKSTTFKKIATNAEFDIKFSDNTFSKGFWGHDTLYFGGIEVPHTQFGVVQKTDNIIGILGLGSDKSKRLPAEKIKYPDDFQTFPFVLQKHGLVKRAVFSLYLDEPNQRSGSVLFGAVDHAKYHGTLHTVPFANYYSQFSPEPLFYDVQLDSIEVEEPGKTATRIPADLVALLDSGSTLCSFNEAILTPLARSLGGVWRESVRLYEVDASAIQERHVSFWISSIKITIPAPRLLVRIKGVSYLGVSLEARQRLILGEEFLRHAYVVFDPERNEVSMAQAKYTALKDVEIVTGDIPRAIRADATAESTENRGTGVLASGNAKAPAAVPKKVRFKEEPEVIGVYDNAKSGEVSDPEGGGENRLEGDVESRLEGDGELSGEKVTEVMTEDPRRSHILSPTVTPMESPTITRMDSQESRETFPITTESVQVSLAATTLFVLDGQENQAHVTQNMEPTSAVKEDQHQISAEVTGSSISEHLEEVSPNHGEGPSQYGDISSIIEDLRSSTDGDDIEKLSSELKYTLGDEASRIEKLSLPLKSSDIDKKPQEPKTNSGYGDLGMDYSSFSLGSSNAKDGNIGRESKKHGEAFLSGEASLSSEVLSPRSETRPGGSEKDAWNLQTALPNNVHKHQPSASPTIAIAPQSSSRPPQSPPNSIEPASNLPPDAIDMNLPEGGTNISEIPSNTIEASADPLKEDQLNEAITLTEINEILRTLDAEEQQPSKHTSSESHPIEKTPSQRQPNDHWHYFHDRLMGELADASPTVSRIRKNTGSVSLPIVESSPDTQADILVEIPSESNSGELFPSAQNLVSLPGAESSESLPYRTIGKSALNGFHAKTVSDPSEHGPMKDAPTKSSPGPESALKASESTQMYSAKIKAEETTESCAITKTSLMNASPSARVPSLGSYKGQDTTINITSDLFRAIQEDGVRSEGHDDTHKQLTTSRPGGVQDLSTGSKGPKKYATSALTAVSLSHVDPLVLSPNVITSQRGVSTPNNDTKVLFGNGKETFSGPGGEEKPDTLDDTNPIEIFNCTSRGDSGAACGRGSPDITISHGVPPDITILHDEAPTRQGKGGSTTVSYFHTRVPYDRPLFTRYGAATARPVEYSHLKSVEKQIDGYNDNITSTITTTRYTYRTLATPRNSGTVSDKMPKQQKTTKNSENPSIPRGSSAMSPNVPVSQTIQANTQGYTAETPVPVVKLVNSARSLSFKMSSCFCVSVFIFACLCMV